MSNLIEDVGHPRVNGYPCICRECVSKRSFLQRGGPIDNLCNRDHCTPEERAVIEAALARRQIEVEAIGESTSGILDSGLGLRYYRSVEAERQATDALLAARAKKETE